MPAYTECVLMLLFYEGWEKPNSDMKSSVVCVWFRHNGREQWKKKSDRRESLAENVFELTLSWFSAIKFDHRFPPPIAAHFKWFDFPSFFSRFLVKANRCILHTTQYLQTQFCSPFHRFIPFDYNTFQCEEWIFILLTPFCLI